MKDKDMKIVETAYFKITHAELRASRITVTMLLPLVPQATLEDMFAELYDLRSYCEELEKNQKVKKK